MQEDFLEQTVANQAMQIVWLTERNAALKECNTRLEERLQIRGNLPVIEMGEESDQENQNKEDDNDKICLVLPKQKFNWFKTVDKWIKILAVLLLVTAVANVCQMFKSGFSTDEIVDIISKDHDKRIEKWQHQFDFLDPLDKTIDEMKNKLETSKTNVKELRTRFNALLNNITEIDKQLNVIKKETTNRNGLHKPVIICFNVFMICKP